MTTYTNIKKGDALTIDNTTYYYVGLDKEMKYNNLPCVFLATDPENKNTYARYSIEYLNNRGFNVILKIKYTTTIYNRNNPAGKTITKISTGAPVEPLQFIKTNSDTINLKNDNMRYFIEPKNIIKFYTV